jgi:hypothetical protein
MNPVHMPILLRNLSVEQYLCSEVYGKKGNSACCRLRYNSEVAFARATAADSLQDVIKYSNILLFQPLHAWEHAMINLGNPLWNPAYKTILKQMKQSNNQ